MPADNSTVAGGAEEATLPPPAAGARRGPDSARPPAGRVRQYAPMSAGNRHAATQRTAEVIHPPGRLEDLEMMQPGRGRRRRCVEKGPTGRQSRAIPRRRPRPEGPATGGAGGTIRNPLMSPSELRLQDSRAHNNGRQIEEILGSGQSHNIGRRCNLLQSKTRQGVCDRVAFPILQGKERGVWGGAVGRHPAG